MKTAGVWVGGIAAVLVGAWLVNMLFQRGTSAPPDKVRKAERAVGYPLHGCHVSASDETRIRCDGRGHSVRIDFDVEGAVVQTCVIGATPDCGWQP